MEHKRNRNRRQPPQPQYVPTFEECIVMLMRTFSIIGVAGIKMEWVNHKGDLIITFKGMQIETNKETGQARIIKTSDVVPNAVSRVMGEKN